MRRRCPKCQGRNLVLSELWAAALEFDCDDGQISEEGVTRPGFPYAVDARCLRCYHSWRLRGVLQITDLKDDPTPGEGR